LLQTIRKLDGPGRRRFDRRMVASPSIAYSTSWRGGNQHKGETELTETLSAALRQALDAIGRLDAADKARLVEMRFRRPAPSTSTRRPLTHAEIDAAMTPAGGWSHESPTDPIGGGQERMIEPALGGWNGAGYSA
jgi:hypothetical protein